MNSTHSPGNRKRSRPDHWEKPDAVARRRHEGRPSTQKRLPEERPHRSSGPKESERLDERTHPARAEGFARRHKNDVTESTNGFDSGRMFLESGRQAARNSMRLANLPAQNPPPSLPPRYKEGRRLEPMNRPVHREEYPIPQGQIRSRPPTGVDAGAGLRRSPLNRGGSNTFTDRTSRPSNMNTNRREDRRHGRSERSSASAFYRL
mmetsp:Transcript_8584/g.16867  ORF Transcript_8584/g.16867 Transcript_8584/m.16867 type:complete len:206 (-) Transcript_8584:199-816(-)